MFSIVLNMLLWSLIWWLLYKLLGSRRQEALLDILLYDCRFYAAEVVTALEYLHCQGSYIHHTTYYMNEIISEWWWIIACLSARSNIQLPHLQ